MKKVLVISLMVLSVFWAFMLTNTVYAVTAKNVVEADGSINGGIEGKIIELKKSEAKTLEDYKNKYGSDAYGWTAYLLNIVRFYSIPFCFLGIAISAIHQYVIGMKKMENEERGFGLMVSFVTILIICQILPLAFAVFVKFGRG